MLHLTIATTTLVAVTPTGNNLTNIHIQYIKWVYNDSNNIKSLDTHV